MDLNDAPRGVKKRAQLDHQRELLTTTGIIDIKAFLNAIHQTGFDGPVRAEPFNALLRKMDETMPAPPLQPLSRKPLR